MKATLTLFVLALLVANSYQISEKGRKLAGNEDDANDLESEDIFADEDFDMGFSLDEFGDEDDFGDDDEGEGEVRSFFDQKPRCVDLEEGADNSTLCEEEEEGEPRVSDALLEQLMAQVWADAQHQLQQDEQVSHLLVPINTCDSPM